MFAMCLIIPCTKLMYLEPVLYVAFPEVATLIRVRGMEIPPEMGRVWGM